jgi:hypothetical protein
MLRKRWRQQMGDRTVGVEMEISKMGFATLSAIDRGREEAVAGPQAGARGPALACQKQASQWQCGGVRAAPQCVSTHGRPVFSSGVARRGSAACASSALSHAPQSAGCWRYHHVDALNCLSPRVGARCDCCVRACEGEFICDHVCGV